MSLIHAVVARGSTVLVEYGGMQEHIQATKTILPQVPSNNSKLTFSWQQYLIHCSWEEGITYLVIADESVGKRTPFAFLSELQRKFASAPSSSSDSTPAYALQSSFGPVITALIHTYNTDPPSDEISRAQAELNQVKDIMVHNVEQIISRGERIQLLVDKTDAMAGQATAFRRGARNVRRNMWWKSQKVLYLSYFVGLILLWLLVAQFCGATLGYCVAW